MGYFAGYIGTYGSPHSYGIYHFALDAVDGSMSTPEPFLPVHDSKYLALREDGLLRIPPIFTAVRFPAIV